MHRINPTVLALLAALLCISPSAAGAMESPSFRIPTSAFSGAGGLTESNNFRLEATLGQSSPLMDPADPPYSDRFDAYPGFWYTVAPALAGYCTYDYEPDGDVDGKDLVEFMRDFVAGVVTVADLEDFSTEFGRSPCQK